MPARVLLVLEGYFNLKVKTVIFQILAIPCLWIKLIVENECIVVNPCPLEFLSLTTLLPASSSCTIRLKCFSSANWLRRVMVTSHRDMGVFTITTSHDFTRTLRNSPGPGPVRSRCSYSTVGITAKIPAGLLIYIAWHNCLLTLKSTFTEQHTIYISI